MKLTREDKIVNVFTGITLSIFTIITIYPLYYAFIYAFNSADDIASNGFIFLFPREITLENFRIIFTEHALIRAFVVSVLRTVIGTVLSVLFTALVSYPLSKKYLLFRKGYLRIGVITMYFSGGLIPFYLLLNSLHLIDTFAVYIIPLLFSFFSAIIMINFFRTIPDSFEEAAKIDGANDLYIFARIYIPLSFPVIATITLFNGVHQWNSWFDSAFYTNSDELITLQFLLFNIINRTKGVQLLSRKLAAGQINMNIIEALKYSTIVILIVPVIMAYPLLQKYFVKGMLVGSIKG